LILSRYTCRYMASLVTLQAQSPELDTQTLDEKEQHLFRILGGLGRVIVAYSGGTDSAYLAWAAHHVLGHNAIAITADSASIPESHKRDAEAFAKETGLRHEYISTYEFENPDYVKNDKDRCFHCKDELFTRLDEYAARRGFDHVIYGVNKDDLGDYRPGQKAAAIHEVPAPLADAGLTKPEIRELARRAGLSIWDRPAAACLSSRVPYGTAVTVETIKTIEQGEESLKALGFRQFRVRFHGDLVRIEIAKPELAAAMRPEMFEAFVQIFRPLGFHYVTLDVEGYRQGSLNAALQK
jgi:pyridinium-3,5-biscarboxylic acid mononucleotide sulfurtransferase